MSNPHEVAEDVPTKNPKRNLKLLRRCTAAVIDDRTPTETLRAILGKRWARDAERVGLEDAVMMKVGRVSADPKALAEIARALAPTMSLQDRD
jgi:hypothetical protein